MKYIMDIKLPTINKIKEFVNDVTKIEGEETLISGRYIVNAKSLMAIFGLDLSSPIRLEIACNSDDADRFKKYSL